MKHSALVALTLVVGATGASAEQYHVISKINIGMEARCANRWLEHSS